MRTHFTSILNRFAVVVALLVAFVGSTVQVTPVHAASIVVNTSADVINPNQSIPLNDGQCTLREAINAAIVDFHPYAGSPGECQPGSGADTISFANNYTITLINGQLPYITNTIMITGKGAGNTIIQAAASQNVADWRVFQVTPTGNLTLDGVMVRHGHCYDSCTVLGDIRPNAGGGIYNTGTLTITNSTISANLGLQSAGGVYNSGTLTVINSVFSENTSPAHDAYGGGGIYNTGSLTVTNSTFSGNSGYYGGGIFNEGGTLNVSNSTFSGNHGRVGGGINNINDGVLSGIVTVTNSTFYENSAETIGGGGIASMGTLTVTNSTFSENSAGMGGQDIHGSSTLKNTIVASSTYDDNCWGTITNGGNNLDKGTSCGWGTSNGSMSNTDPKLGPLAGNGGTTQTMALMSGSPAINAGGDANCPATDQRGVSRPQGSHCDIGAYEALIISGNAGVAGATLSYVDGIIRTVTADGNGNYTISVPYGWYGTVIPSLNADAFCPVSQPYNNLTTSRTLQHFAHTSCPNFGAANKWSSSFDLSHSWTVSQYVRTLGDVSGDGRADVVGFGLDGVYVGPSNGWNFAHPTKWTSAFDLAHGWTVSQYIRSAGDVNGDGKDDLVGFGLDGVYVGLSTGSSFNSPSKWVTAFDLAHGWTVSDFVRTVGDVNGDNMDDLIGFGLDGVYISLSTGSSFPAPTKWTSAFDLLHGWTVAQYVRTVGDVNGDGKADLVGFGLDGVYVATSTGRSFNALSKWVNAFDLSHGWTVSQFVRTVGDVNGDGKADIVGFGQDGVYVSLSLGNGFSLPSRRTMSFDLSHGWTVSQYVRTVGDVNGGGRADLVGFGLDGVYVAQAQ